MMNAIQFFTDPILRAPTIGSMLMCLASSLIGVVVFIRKKSLLGESLSHASYPGVVLSIVCSAALFPHSEEGAFFAILVGAFISSLFGLWLIDQMERRLHVKSDAALCFVLSSLFGIGVLIASRIQFTHALWYKQIQNFLYGQTATMMDMHVVIYGSLSLSVIIFLVLLYRPIEVINFDRNFAQSVGMKVSFVDASLFLLLVLAIVIGIRSVGIVLMAGMLIAPAVAARQFTHRLSWLFVLSGVFGIISGFCGNYFSLLIPQWLATEGEHPFSLPTGPMILLTASFICFISLLLAPKTGLVSRLVRIKRFRSQCVRENILKAFWKRGEGAHFFLKEIACGQRTSRLYLYLQLRHLCKKGWLIHAESSYRLTPSGYLRASKIIRLHRLWEAYLVDYLGQGVEKVHSSAEEMEHIITDDLEKELTELLNNPTHDPHQQPIPSPTAAPVGVL